MSAYEDSYKSQLQGVSQQIARERLDGQVTAQDNMLSDTVTNLRRRPGCAFAYSIAMPGATADSILAWDTNLAGTQCQVVLNTTDGVVRLLDSSYALLATLPASAYLTTADVGSIQVATVGDEFFIANLSQKPTLGASDAGASPVKRGFFYVKAGAFSKSYDVKVQTSAGSATATYTTPNGTGAGDAALSTGDYIAAQLVAAINAGTATHNVTAVAETSYVYLSCATATNLVATSGAGINYLITSGSAYLRQEADLPSRLPAGAAGYIISTGELRSLRYYKYDATKLAWLETGDYTSPLSITNVPVSITKVGAVWTMLANTFEGRLAGDTDSNPDPAFILRGITGMSNYQGRLVLLSGALVNMSASGKPRRFYRSTVTSLLDSDCIEVGAAAASSAAFRYAVPFDKDLLLFSEKYQAVISGSNVAITPRTASVVVSSTYSADITSRPVPVGRTMMYATPRSKDFFGLMEMLPNPYSDAKYTSYDSTAHLPKYMAGRCRFSVSSSGAGMVLFAPTNDRRSLIVHEYTWQGDQKVQQSWHKWTFNYPVAAAYFSGQVIHLVFVNNGTLLACTIDPRSGTNNSLAERIAKLDFNIFADVVAGVVTLPAWYTAFDPAVVTSLKLGIATGALAGEGVGSYVVAGQLKTDASFAAGRVCVGVPFTSTFSPTPPMKKDDNGVKISTNKLTVLRFMLGTYNSSQYDVTVKDAASSDVTSQSSTLYFSSAELALGQAQVGADSTAIIPARTNANSTSLIISTSGVGELNVVALEFVAKYNEKINRARKH